MSEKWPGGLDLYIRENFSYDAGTGVITRKNGIGGHSAGKIVGSIKARGYRRIVVLGRSIAAHRVAWFLHYSEWPSQWLDHINRNPQDNRIDNLRIATPSQNQGNRGKQSNNRSGFKGVIWNKRCNKYQAQINKKGKTVYLGLFDDPKEAAHQYQLAAKEYYGEFASF